MLKPFLAFLKSYDANQVHNILVMMLYLRFKHLLVVKNYVGQGNAIHFAYEYDAKVVIPHHMIFFHQLNPIIQGCNVDGPSEELNEDTNILVLELLLKSFHVLLLLENCLCLKDFMYSKLHAMIPLLGGTSTKINFQMLHF